MQLKGRVMAGSDRAWDWLGQCKSRAVSNTLKLHSLAFKFQINMQMQKSFFKCVLSNSGERLLIAEFIPRSSDRDEPPTESVSIWRPGKWDATTFHTSPYKLNVHNHNDTKVCFNAIIVSEWSLLLNLLNHFIQMQDAVRRVKHFY